MTLLSAYPQFRLFSLAFLALLGIILGGLAAGLANLYTDLDFFLSFNRLKAAAGLLAFDGFFILVWSIALFILSLKVHEHETTSMKWLVGPLGLAIQSFVLWILVLGGAAALSDSQGGLDCRYTGGGKLATFCNVGNATLAFGWILWIALSVILGLLVFYALKTPKAQGGLSTSDSRIGKDLESGKVEQNNQIPLSTSQAQPSAPDQAPVAVQPNQVAPSTETETYQMPQPTHHQG